ncbi:hypothetical protein PsorP6_006099 [Peronosclerospora sorghi]|uniref:Uncharacterized protein n=1 Tax=Peronosclerospora sorghi TaxID=230839 RepID=A0ACC0W3Q6_9STRA|nr:hypothetical protein PsorP6_006099 [Peronosclerospora sorghi]
MIACDPHLRDSLANDGLEVVANEGHTKLLGILQSPTRPHSTRFDSLLPQMVARCQLWKFRGRTLRGRAVLLRSVILPLLWYVAAVTPIPPKLLIKSEIFAKPSSSKNQFELIDKWLYWPTTKGGLGLPSTKEFGPSLGLCSLRDSITFARRYVTHYQDGLNRPRPTTQPVWTVAAKRSISCMFRYPILLQPQQDGLAWEVSGFRSSRIGGFSVTAISILTFYPDTNTTCQSGLISCLQFEQHGKLFTAIALYLESPVRWQGIAYLQDLAFASGRLEQFGHRNLLRVFHIIRAATLYPIWIHRNHRIFQHVQSSTLYIRGRAIAYTKLHLTRIIMMSPCPKVTRLSRQVLRRLEMPHKYPRTDQGFFLDAVM